MMMPRILTQTLVFLPFLNTGNAFAFQSGIRYHATLARAVLSRPSFLSSTTTTSTNTNTALFYRTTTTEGQDEGAAANRLLLDMDLDEDGTISFDELDLHLSNVGLYDTTGLVAKPIFERMDLNSDGALSLDEIVQATRQFVQDHQGSKYFLDEAYNDVTRLFQTMTAHGDGTISKDMLSEHLMILSRDDQGNAESAVQNILALLDDNADKDELTLNDVTVAFIRYYAVQRAFYGEGDDDVDTFDDQ